MTAYNREKYIAASIESVLAQTFEDFELVIVDDCSQDRTVEIAQRYLFDSRVRVVVNKRNLGDYPNRNNAAKYAYGQFLKYHDSDDLMYPHCLATMIMPLQAEPSAGFALSGSKYWIGGPCPMLLTPRMCYQREFLGSGMFVGGPACALFRTDILHKLGGFPNQGVGSDHIFWLKACAKVNVLLLPADLFWYRVHAGQELQSDRAARDYAIVPGEVWRALHSPDCPLDGKELAQAKRNWTYILAKLTYYDLRAGRFSLAHFRLKSTGLSVRGWLIYFRRPRRSTFAGTPLDEHGDYIMPNFLARRLKPEVRSICPLDIETTI